MTGRATLGLTYHSTSGLKGTRRYAVHQGPASPSSVHLGYAEIAGVWWSWECVVCLDSGHGGARRGDAGAALKEHHQQTHGARS